MEKDAAGCRAFNRNYIVGDPTLTDYFDAYYPMIKFKPERNMFFNLLTNIL